MLAFGTGFSFFFDTEEKLARSKKNPRRVGADFHDNLRRAGLLDTDDEKWYVTRLQ